jgi:hypothetical protein
LSLDGGSLVLQPAFSDCLLLDLLSPLQDLCAAAVRLFPAHAGMNRDATWVTQNAHSPWNTNLDRKAILRTKRQSTMSLDKECRASGNLAFLIWISR